MNKSDLERLSQSKTYSNQPLVLVVEDNPTQQKLYQLIADKLDIKLWVTGSADEALEATDFVAFDVILMDVHLKGDDGVDCARRIQELDRRRNRHTPIIAVTACAMEGDRERFIASGMDDYLSKPFTINELREKIGIWAV